MSFPPWLIAAISSGGRAGGSSLPNVRVNLPTDPGPPSGGLFPGDPGGGGFDPGANPYPRFELPEFDPFIPPIDTGFGPQAGVTPGTPLDPWGNEGMTPPGQERPRNGPGMGQFPMFISPLGTQYFNIGGTWVNAQGIPRATAVNPSDDPYGLSGPTVGPQANPSDFAGPSGSFWNGLLGITARNI